MKKIVFTTLVVVMAFVSMSTSAQSKSKRDLPKLESTTLSEMSVEDCEAYLNGDLLVINKKVNGVDTRPLHKVVATALVGVRVLDGDVFPVGTLRLGYEIPHFIIETEGSLSKFSCYDEAMYQEKYTSLIVGINGGYKVWRDKYDFNYLSLNVNAGYAFQMDDSELAKYQNASYGFTFGVFARYSYHLAPRLKLVSEIGYKSYPQTDYLGYQENVGGIFANVGVSCVF